MKVARTGKNLRGKKESPIKPRQMKLVPFEELTQEQQAEHRKRRGKKPPNKNVWVSA